MYKIYKNKVFKTKIGKLIKFANKESKFLKNLGRCISIISKFQKKKMIGYYIKNINVLS